MDQRYPGFWDSLEKPVIGLAPMDGVTNLACRRIVALHGRPDVLFTEFTSAEGLFYAPDRLLRDFEYEEAQRPIVAQIYGHRPEDFYRAAHIVCELGFDGIDINMGCPSKSVTQRNCGAKLITVPDLALEIIRSTRQGVHDWASGQTLEGLKIKEKVLKVVRAMNDQRCRGVLPYAPTGNRQIIPVSVKTRIGFDSVVIEWWIEILLQEQPVVVSIHGRTLKQMYRGEADWGAIARAVQVAKGSGTLIFGNGDVRSLEEAGRRITETGVDGVLLGRSTIGNPWVFRDKDRLKASLKQGTPCDFPNPFVAPAERFRVALEHMDYFLKLRGDYHFQSIKKHLSGYLSHFPEASVIRSQAMRARTPMEVTSLLKV